MNPISKSNFAKQIGVTPQYMPKIEAQLSMISVPGKKKQQIDLHGASTLRFSAEREIQIKDVEPDPAPKKKSCSHCVEFALLWRKRLLNKL